MAMLTSKSGVNVMLQFLICHFIIDRYGYSLYWFQQILLILQCITWWKSSINDWILIWVCSTFPVKNLKFIKASIRWMINGNLLKFLNVMYLHDEKVCSVLFYIFWYREYYWVTNIVFLVVYITYKFLTLINFYLFRQERQIQSSTKQIVICV